MKSRPLLRSLALLAAICLFSQLDAEAAPKKNVLWIYLEDVSGWFGCYGEKLIETPRIDALAAGGIRLDRKVCITARS